MLARAPGATTDFADSLQTLMVEVNGVRHVTWRRLDLDEVAAGLGFRAGLFEMRQDDGLRFFTLRPGADGWPTLEDVSSEVTVTLVDRLDLARARKRQAEALKSFWLTGVRPPQGRRRGSRGPRIREEDQGENAVQLLANLYRRGAITALMLRAGNRFHNEFQSAHLPVLQASDFGRLKVDATPRAVDRPEGGTSAASQRRVQAVFERIGGLDTRAGSVLYHVVGLEISLREWSDMHDRWGLDRKAVPGVLLAVLDQLVNHYGLRTRCGYDA